MTLHTNGALPLHAQIAETIRQRIADGTYAVGDRLPSLRKLSDEFGVAEPTVHAAIRALQQSGIVVSTSGRGTFVSQPVDASNPPIETQVAELREQVDTLTRRLDRLESDSRTGHEQNDHAAGE